MSEHAISTINCRAYGCPNLGTMTRSTSGTTEWFCFAHFAAELDQWQAISAEMNRLKWLVDVTRKIRENALSNPLGWPAVEAALHKEIALAQRRDLRRGDHEHVNHWLARLEGVLRQSVAVTQASVA